MKKLGLFISITLFTGQVHAQQLIYRDSLCYQVTSDSTVMIIRQDWSYDNYSGLTTLVVPEKIIDNGIEYDVTSISSEAFRYCTTLKSVTIPNSVTNIGINAFAGCSNIATLSYDGTISDWNTKVGYKVTEWYNGVSATVLTCTDGTIALADAD